jgi:N-acetylneuraminate synthase
MEDAVMENFSRRRVRVGSHEIGDGQRIFVIAEIGINHNGSLGLARQLIDGAVAAGCDAVKFQKRTPELCVPRDQWERERDTPWGRITYIEYRRRIEFGLNEYVAIDRHCREKGILWFASCWDVPSVRFLEAFEPPLYKAASASLTDHELLLAMRRTSKPLLISTGMSTMEEIEAAVETVGTQRLLLAHSTSTYPCPPHELNLRMIPTLQKAFPGVPIGYSGHETGLATTSATLALGASFLERHITVDRSLWGSDQAASVELPGLQKLVRDVRDIELALGDGIKRVYDSELEPRRRLRRVAAPGALVEVSA